mmetsp:Transcript_14455/g.43027  ORF Transcript_14455/g.43027 Transcript_14455/m.43027 type:complete len:289 (+) Transcript_14455:42-908(+)
MSNTDHKRPFYRRPAHVRTDTEAVAGCGADVQCPPRGGDTWCRSVVHTTVRHSRTATACVAHTTCRHVLCRTSVCACRHVGHVRSVRTKVAVGKLNPASAPIHKSTESVAILPAVASVATIATVAAVGLVAAVAAAAAADAALRVLAVLVVLGLRVEPHVQPRHAAAVRVEPGGAAAALVERLAQRAADALPEARAQLVVRAAHKGGEVAARVARAARARRHERRVAAEVGEVHRHRRARRAPEVLVKVGAARRPEARVAPDGHVLVWQGARGALADGGALEVVAVEG